MLQAMSVRSKQTNTVSFLQTRSCERRLQPYERDRRSEADLWQFIACHRYAHQFSEWLLHLEIRRKKLEKSKEGVD